MVESRGSRSKDPSKGPISYPLFYVRWEGRSTFGKDEEASLNEV